MTRKLVIFNDRSWSKPQYRSRKRSVAGNATLAHQCLTLEDDKGARQISLLQSDNQSDNAFFQFIERTLGTGVRRDVLSAYHFLVHNYMLGDEIFLIGAGKGAYTLQCLSDMISISGLLPIEHLDKIKEAYTFSKLAEDARNGPTGQDLKNRFRSRPVKIRFLGCWDTVGASGVPTIGLQTISRLWTEFLRDNLHETIESAYQALAIDDTNPAYAPHIWTGRKSPDLKKIEQVWFAGKHANVTGGQRDSRLSDISLHWLLNKAGLEGLKFDADKLEDLTTPDPLGCIAEESRFERLIGKFSRRPYLRPVGVADTYLSRAQLPGTEKIHPSINVREIKDTPYTPKALATLPPESLPIASEMERPRQSTRRYERIQADCPATLLVKSSRFNGNILDFSAGGARIWASLDLPVGTPIILRSSVLFEEEKEGHVVWVKNQTLGLEFAGEMRLDHLNLHTHNTLQ